MLKYLATLVIVGATITPPAKTPTLAVNLHQQASTGTVWAVYTVTAGGTPDSLFVDIAPTPGTTVTRPYAGAAIKDSIIFPAPAPADSIIVRVRARSKRRALYSAYSAWVQRKYIAPDSAPPVPAVTLELIPASFNIAPSASRGLCGLYHHASGALDFLPGSNPDFCFTVPADEPPAVPLERDSIPKGVIAWRATCGTITAQGLYTAPASAQPCAVIAAFAGVVETTTVDVRVGGMTYARS